MISKSVLVIGSGPIIIGQAAEFDYAGAQACKSLREEGYKVILLNSNPATIMTDTDIADRVYIEPLTIEIVEDILVITPERCFCMIGKTYLIIKNMPVRFTSIICLHFFAVILIGPLLPGPIPTLFCKIFN